MHMEVSARTVAAERARSRCVRGRVELAGRAGADAGLAVVPARHRGTRGIGVVYSAASRAPAPRRIRARITTAAAKTPPAPPADERLAGTRAGDRNLADAGRSQVVSLRAGTFIAVRDGTSSHITPRLCSWTLLAYSGAIDIAIAVGIARHAHCGGVCVAIFTWRNYTENEKRAIIYASADKEMKI